MPLAIGKRGHGPVQPGGKLSAQGKTHPFAWVLLPWLVLLPLLSGCASVWDVVPYLFVAACALGGGLAWFADHEQARADLVLLSLLLNHEELCAADLVALLPPLCWSCLRKMADRSEPVAQPSLDPQFAAGTRSPAPGSPQLGLFAPAGDTSSRAIPAPVLDPAERLSRFSSGNEKENEQSS